MAINETSVSSSSSRSNSNSSNSSNNNDRTWKTRLATFYRKYKALIQIFLFPLLASIIPIIFPNPRGLCAFVLLLMSAYWVAICVPIAVTSLLPVFIFPLFGIMSSESVAQVFFNDNIMFIMGSLMIGIGVETSNLHQKLALRAVLLVGSHPRWLLLGIMTVSWFLSIWISNTAITAMMLPIVMSLVKNLVKLDKDFHEKPLSKKPTSANIYTTVDSKVSLAVLVEKYEVFYMHRLNNSNKKLSYQKSQKEKNEEVENGKDNGVEVKLPHVETNDDEDNIEIDEKELFESPKALNAIKCFLLCIPYATLIGGSASLIGTNSNLVFKGYFERVHPDDGMNFFTFMAYAFPCSLINLICAWLVIGSLYLPKEKFFDFKSLFQKNKIAHLQHSTTSKGSDPLVNLVKRKYNELGPYTWDQISVGAWFVIVILLLVTRDLHFVPGWGSIFTKSFVTDTTVAISILFILIVWPKKNLFKGEDYSPLILWTDIEKMFPWSVIILLGGSLVMAKGCEVSGLSEWIGRSLEHILPNNAYIILFIMNLVSSLGTEFMSNVSSITIILPILDQIAIDKQISYFFLLLPQSFAVNLSYMLPSAAAPNAIVFGVGYLKLVDMILVGFIMKLIGLVLIFVNNFWLLVIFPWDNGIIRANTTATLFLNATTQLPIITTDLLSF